MKIEIGNIEISRLSERISSVPTRSGFLGLWSEKAPMLHSEVLYLRFETTSTYPFVVLLENGGTYE